MRISCWQPFPGSSEIIIQTFVFAFYLQTHVYTLYAEHLINTVALVFPICRANAFVLSLQSGFRALRLQSGLRALRYIKTRRSDWAKNYGT
jgi:hypothetical protein